MGDVLADDIAFDVDVASDGTVWVATLAGVSEFRPAGAGQVPTATAGTTPTSTAPPPTQVPSATPTSKATVIPSATPTVGSAVTPPTGPCVCSLLRGRVPDAAIADALANPGRFYGWNMLRHPRLPEGPFNPRRTCLALERPGVPYHPLFNSLEWSAGCP